MHAFQKDQFAYLKRMKIFALQHKDFNCQWYAVFLNLSCRTNFQHNSNDDQQAQCVRVSRYRRNTEQDGG
jgi:hypothetical protein